MFDIGFSELLVIGIVALIVIGPERLPKVARTVGAWLGRLNRYVAQVKQDIDRDMRLEELRKLQQDMKDSAQKYEILADQAGKRVQEEVSQVDRVIAAMAATDGGLAQREYDRIKAEEQSGGSADAPAEAAEGAAAAPAAAPSGAESTVAPPAFQSSLHDPVTADEPAAAEGAGVQAVAGQGKGA